MNPFNLNRKYINAAIAASLFALLALGGLWIYRHNFSGRAGAVSNISHYTCPMHPQIHEDKPGECPICHMSLIPVYKDGAVTGESGGETALENSSGVNEEGELSHYTCPMHPQIKSDKEGQCPICHMDLIPVYKDSAGKEGEVAITISESSQKLIGVKISPVEKKNIVSTIHTTGRVAFDPDLSVAIREYLAVRNADYSLRRGAVDRLKLLGMGDEEIRQLPYRQKSYESLYLPTNMGTVWVYATLYENELGTIKPGMKAVIKHPYQKDKIYPGTVRSLSPVIDPVSRSVTARIEVPNAGGKLLPDSFVNADIKVALGNQMVVPRTAVLDSGNEQIVFILRNKKKFIRRVVKAGLEADDDRIILEGLAVGEEVVSSALFLIDSESRLKAAVPEKETHDR